MDMKTQAVAIAFNTALDAVNYVKGGEHWSRPITIENPDERDKFTRTYSETDWSTNGLIHYSKK